MRIRYEPGDKVYLPEENEPPGLFYIIKTLNRRLVVLEPAEHWRIEPDKVQAITEILPALTTTERAKIIN
jgi:hypothetical protein